MKGYNRLEQIMGYLEGHNPVTVDGLVAVVNVSSATIRRNLIKLDEQGVISHTCGGVILNRFTSTQPTTHKRVQRNLAEEHVIASVAASMVKVGDPVVLDTDMTMIELARQATRLSLHVITSNLHIALFLARFKQIEVTIIGRRTDDSSQSCIGEHSRRLLQNTWPNVAFLSYSSWDLEKGITAPTEEKAAPKHDLIAHTSRKVLLADSSKYGSWLLFSIARLNKLTEIIADSQLDGQTRRILASSLARLVIVGQSVILRPAHLAI